MPKGPGSAPLPSTPGSRKPVPRSLSCLSDMDRRPCRAPGCDPRLRPIIQRRSRSLPTSPERRAKAAGAPGAACGAGCNRQVRVRFADALGLELAQVKVFNAGDDPSVPLHVLSRLAINSDLCCSSQDLEFTLQCLVPDFPPPIEAPGFGERLARQLVCLERVTCSDLGISGTVRVRNVAFEKQVTVRYTFLAGAVSMRRWHAGEGLRVPKVRRTSLPSAFQCLPSCWSSAPRYTSPCATAWLVPSTGTTMMVATIALLVAVMPCTCHGGSARRAGSTSSEL